MSQQSSTTPTKSGGGITRSAFLAKLPLLCRVVELSLAIIVLGLIIDPINAKLQHNVNHVGITYVAFAGFILINSVLIISELTGEPLPKTPLLLFAFTGGVLFVAAGAIIIHDWRTQFYTMHFHPPKMYMDMMIASGIIAIFNAALFFVDVGLTIRYASAAGKYASDVDSPKVDKAQTPQHRPKGVSEEQQTDLSDFAV